MKKILTLFLMLLVLTVVAQENTLIRIPSSPVVILNPDAVYPPLENGFTIEEIDGIKYFKVPLNGWGIWTHFPAPPIPEEATHIRLNARYEAGTSGVPAENAQSYFQFFSPFWERTLVMAQGESNTEFKEFTAPLDFTGPVGIIQVAAQDRTNGWAAVFGGTIYFNKVEVYTEGTPEYNLTFYPQGGTKQINISSDIAWTLSSDQPWLEMDKNAGTGNDVVNLTVPALVPDEVRAAIVTIHAEGYDDQKLIVTQYGGITEFSPGDLAVLKNIRDNARTGWWEPLQNQWRDDINPISWPGVTWTDQLPRKVTRLDIGYKGISTLDVTPLDQLVDLYCYGNEMTFLNVTNLKYLRNLDAGNNFLTGINLTGVNALNSLGIYSNRIQALNLKDLWSFNSMDCSWNQLTILDLSKVPTLRYLSCSNNELKTLIMGGISTMEGADLQQNRLPFSQLLLPSNVYSWYSFGNQKPVFEERTVDPGTLIDFSSEAMIGGNATLFSWYKNNVQIPGEALSAFTPTEDGYYFCRMTNATFPGLTIETKAIKVGNPPEFDLNDLAVLKTIRDGAPTAVDQPLATIWADGIDPMDWPGVTWSEQLPRKVVKLEIINKAITSLNVTLLDQLRELRCWSNQITSLKVENLAHLTELNAGGNQLETINLEGLAQLTSLHIYGNHFTSIDLTGLTNLEQLNIDANQFTSLDLSGVTNLRYLYGGYNELTSINLGSITHFYGINIQGNRLPFSKLPLPSMVENWYQYQDQKQIFEERTIDPGTLINFSSEAMINGVATVFSWFKNSVQIPGEASSTFSPTEEGFYFCRMTNATFPGLTLETRAIKVGNPSEFDLNDLAVLKTIRDGASTTVDQPLATIWAEGIDPMDWPGVTWSEQPPRRVIQLQVQYKGVPSMDVSALSLLNNLSCFGNRMTSLNMAGLAQLQTLDAGENYLTDLNLSGLASLQFLNLYNNKLESLDLTGLSSLRQLYCDYNRLTTLNLTGISQLEFVQLMGNNLPFSQLPAPGMVTNQYSFSPQNKVFDKVTIPVGTPISYPTEQNINGADTYFTWYRDGVEIPDAGHSFTYTPDADGFYHCTMTNGSFPGLTLTTNFVTVGNPPFDYDLNDLAILLKIRDDMPYWSWFREAWANEMLPGEWPNVTWTETTPGEPKRVTFLNISWQQIGSFDVTGLTELRTFYCSGTNITDLDLTGLSKLEALNCNNNALTSLDLDGLDNLVSLLCYDNDLASLDVSTLENLSNVDCFNNRIPFSRMPLSEYPLYVNGFPQKPLFVDYVYSEGFPISYPSEVTVGGFQTYFTWYKNNEVVLENDLTGTYMPTGEGWYYCTMTNEFFPGQSVRTFPVKVGNPIEYDPADIAILLAIRDAAPANSPLRWEWANVNNIGNWPRVTWDFAPKKVVQLQLQYTELITVEVTGLSRLQSLYVNNNPLTSLTVHDLPELVRIGAMDGKLSTITLSNLPKLGVLDLPNNLFESITLSDLPTLGSLYLQNNKLTDLHLTNLPNLYNLNIQNNYLTTLDISAQPNIYVLNCSFNQLTSLVINENLKTWGFLSFENNFLPFSEMPIWQPNHWGFYYIPQGKIFEEMTIPVKSIIDYSSEALIDGVQTQFSWYLNGTLIEGTDNTGTYMPMVPGIYRCEMTNEKFPGLTLVTNDVTAIIVAPQAVCNDIEVVLDMDGNYTLTKSDYDRLAEGSSDRTDTFDQLLVEATPSQFTWEDVAAPVEVLVTVTNTSGFSATCTATVTVKKRMAELTYTGDISVQYSDLVTLSALLTDAETGLPIPGQEVTFTLGTQTAVFTTDESGVASGTLTITQAPAETQVVVTYAGNSTFLPVEATNVFEINKEDALLNYVGTELAATLSTTSLNAKIDLRVMVEDMPDLFRGDITNAKVKFVNMTGTSPMDITSWIPVTDLMDPTTGVVNYLWNVTLSKGQTAETFTVYVYVDGYYEALEEVVITVYVPSGDFITGGGHIIPGNSDGLYASDEGTKTRFGFNVRYNKRGTSLQGKLNFIFRSGGKTYQVTSNATVSLGVNTNDKTALTAQFVSKCTMNDITNPGSPLSMGGNLTMQVFLTDRGEAGSNDDIAFTLWDGNTLLYSSNWNGTATSPTQLMNGNIVISTSTTNSGGGKKSAEAVVALEQADNGLLVYPNPFKERLYFEVNTPVESAVLLEVYNAAGSRVQTIFDGRMTAGQTARFEYRPDHLTTQMVIYKVIINGEVTTGKALFKN